MKTAPEGWFTWIGANTAHFFVAADPSSICGRGYGQPRTSPWPGCPRCGQCARRLAAQARLAARKGEVSPLGIGGGQPPAEGRPQG